MAEKETKTELKKPESKKKEKLEPKQNWSSNEKQTSKDVYGCEILVDNGTMEEVSKTEYPNDAFIVKYHVCLLYTSPSPRDPKSSRMPSSA